MNITYDYYFFVCLMAWVVAIAIVCGIAYWSVKYERVGKIVWTVFIVGVLSYDLAMCSEITARGQRPSTTISKGEL